MKFSCKLEQDEKEYANYCLTLYLHNELDRNFLKNLSLNNVGEFLKNNSVWLPLFIVGMTGNYINGNVMVGIPPNLGKSLFFSQNISLPKAIKPVLNKKSLDKRQKEDQKKLAARENLQKVKMDSEPKWQESFESNTNLKFVTAIDSTSRSCLIVVDRTKNFHSQIGRSGSYKNLGLDKVLSGTFMRKNYPNFHQLCETNNDHLVCDCLHNLIKFNRDKAYCITTSKQLNCAKEYSKKGQEMPCKIDELTGVTFSEITHA